MPRYRTRSYNDAKTIAAIVGVQAFLQNSRLSATALARLIKVSPSVVLRALQADPLAWTPTRTALKRTRRLCPTARVLGKISYARCAGSARATAAVLWAVADLLELEAAR